MLRGSPVKRALLARLRRLQYKAAMSSQFLASLVTLAVILGIFLLGSAYLILLERKICAWVQDRIGPNRTSLSLGIFPIRGHAFGLGQPLADGIKLLTKEEYTPLGVDRPLFLLAPVAIVVPAFMAWAVVPWGGYLAWGQTVVTVTAAPISVGVIYILAVGSLAVYGVVLGGFASNNKYSFFGGMRATAQMLSYEIPMGLCVLTIILMTGSATAVDLVHSQVNGVWYCLQQPLLAVIFFTCVLAECNRAPFDIAEAEQELIGGYHTEYASMKWAMFFLGEYMHMISGAAFFTLLFLGGWDLPVIQEPLVGGIGLVLLKAFVFLLKVFVLLALMMVIRWTLPRFRFDQLMRLAWRGLIPITVLMLLSSAFIVFWNPTLAWPWYLAGNVVAVVVVMIVSSFLPSLENVNRRVPLAGSRFSPLQAD